MLELLRNSYSVLYSSCYLDTLRLIRRASEHADEFMLVSLSSVFKWLVRTFVSRFGFDGSPPACKLLLKYCWPHYHKKSLKIIYIQYTGPEITSDLSLFVLFHLCEHRSVLGRQLWGCWNKKETGCIVLWTHCTVYYWKIMPIAHVIAYDITCYKSVKCCIRLILVEAWGLEAQSSDTVDQLLFLLFSWRTSISKSVNIHQELCIFTLD